MGKQIPIVDYLVLDDGDPHLMAHECSECGARYFDRRNACASCGGREFTQRPLPTDGVLRTFTIFGRSDKPFASGVVELSDGTSVKANIVGIDPDPDRIELGMKVDMTTFSAGTDDDGTEAICFGFAPSS
ncbi:MAG: hypothetical protein DCC48_06355 [Acidobacteria bacterium]|nr:MAG: hypothetical protein DCC48_06355 [Acidobacteriota bacterium]